VPANTPVGTPTTLTVRIEHTAGGAQLTTDLIDTLPAGLVVAPTPNASTTCVGGNVNASAGAGSFNLLSGAAIPAGGCSVQVDVVAAAAGIYANALGIGQLQTTLGNNPNASSSNYQATQAGTVTYGTSFEAGTGTPTPYPTGSESSAVSLTSPSKDGWTLINPVNTAANLRLSNPKTGTQLVRLAMTTADGNSYPTIRSKQFLAGTTDYTVTDLAMAVQSTVTPPANPTPAPFDMAPLYVDSATNAVLPVTRVRFAGASTNPPFHATNPVVGVDQTIQVEDAAIGGFVDTDVNWALGTTYKSVRVVTRRSDAAILVCVDDKPIYIGQGANGQVRQMQFAVQRQTGVRTNIYEVDDALLDNRNSGTCSDGAAMVAPVVAKDFSVATVEIDTPFTSTTVLRNWNTTPATLTADFVDTLPPELEVSNATTTCTGAGVTHTTSAVTLGMGAAIPPQGSCTITTTLRAVATGSFSDNIAVGDLQTSAGNNATAPDDTLSVTEVLEAPTLVTTFAPTSVAAGTNSTLRLTINNPNFSALTLSADLVDALPVGLNITAASTTCGGTASFSAGSLRLATGAVIPGQNSFCIVQGTVSAGSSGSYVNTLAAGSLQTTGGNNAASTSATLTVTSATPETVTLARTVGTDLSAGACGSDKVLTVTARTAVNFCYRLTNHTERRLRFHSLTSSNYGRLANYKDVEVLPGATHQINDIRVVTRDTIDSATWQADDALVNYSQSLNPGTVTWEDISSTGAVHTNALSTATIPLPFAFKFYGEPQTVLDMVDGGLGFGRGDQSLNFVNTNIPNATAEMFQTVLPYWDRWQASTVGSLYWQVKGSAPNRRLIAQWHNRKFSATNPNGMRYQAVLFEGSDDIAFVYNQVDNGVTNPADSQSQYSFGKSATIGLNFDGARAARFAYHGEDASASATPVIQNGDSIMYSPSAMTRFSAGDSVGVMVVSAEIQVDSTPIQVPVQQGTTQSRTLTIGNTGFEGLNWDIDPARAANAHVPPLAQAWPDRDVLGVEAMTAMPQHTPEMADAGPVPAYAYTLAASVRSLVSFDVETPSILNQINRYPVSGAPEFDVTGMEFVGSDFTTLYGVSYGADDPSKNGVLHAFDTETGDATWIGLTDVDASGGNEARSDFAYDPVDQKLYLLSYYGVPHTLNLYTVDPATAATTFVTRLNGAASSGLINAIAVNGQGQMYGIDISNDRLVAIDKRSGETAVVGPLGYNANSDQSLDFDERTDTLYWIGGAGPNQATVYSVFTIDTVTGAATLVGGDGYFGTDPFDVGTSAFAIATSHPCSLPTDVDWLSLDATSGLVGPGDTDIVHLSFQPQGLADGSYSALLCIASNDPVTPRTRIPVTMTVNTGNLPPVALTATLRRTIATGQAVNLDLSLLFDEPDNEALTYAMAGAPAGLSIDPQTGFLTGATGPNAAAASPYLITISALDPHGASASFTLQLEVIGALFIDGFE